MKEGRIGTPKKTPPGEKRSAAAHSGKAGMEETEHALTVSHDVRTLCDKAGESGENPTDAVARGGGCARGTLSYDTRGGDPSP